MGRRTLYMQSQLSELGAAVNNLRTEMLNGQPITYNKPDIISVGDEYVKIIKDLDLVQNVSRFSWTGLPPYLTSWLIEEMLYHKGGLCGYFESDVLKILPYAMSDGINAYGMPTAVFPVSYNGTVDGTRTTKKLLVDYTGGLDKSAKAALLFDRPPMFQAGVPISRYAMNDTIINLQAEILGRIKLNLRSSDKKAVFFVNDEKQRRQVQQDLDAAYSSDSPFILVRKDLASDLNNQTFSNDIYNQAQSLFESWQSLNSIRCMCCGIPNGGAFEKKERQVANEKDGLNTQNDIVLNMGLQMRRLFLVQLKLIYPDKTEIINKITVDTNDMIDARMPEDLGIKPSDNKEAEINE